MTDGPLLVDWGTSNRRAWLVDASGARLGFHADDRGMAAIPPGGWEAAYSELLAAFGGVRPRLTLIAGMAGARGGWSEAPYRPCPAGLADLAAHLHWVVPGEVAIVPGLSQVRPDADVMRGEEVQALGVVAAGRVPADAIACLPGTHAKWVRIEAGRIGSFTTAMTGELFALLRRHSLLADFLRAEAAPDADFLPGVERGHSADDLTAELFRVRARALLGTAPSAAPSSYVSGLLIGAEIRGSAPAEAEPIHVIGTDALARLYAAALSHLGRTAVPVDGEEAMVAGLVHIAELIP